MTGDVLIEVRGLRTYFPIRRGLLRAKVGDVKAVDGVSFQIRRAMREARRGAPTR